MGFNEGVFPHVGTEDSILNDDDRDWLAERGVRLSAPRRQRILDESLLAYTALTRAGDAVYVTYADADEDGRALRPSPYVAAIEGACPRVSTVHAGDGYRNRNDANIWTMRDLAERLVFEFRNRPDLDLDTTDVRGRWNDLYEAARRADGLESALSPAVASLAYRNEATITPESASQLAGRPLRASVSRLETMATCPFKHFARYGLRLKDRSLAEFADVDVGTIHHAILEHFVREVVERRESLSDLDPQRIESMLRDSAEEVAASVTAPEHTLTPRDRYILRRSAQDLDRVMSAQRRIARAGKFRPRGAEVAFGREEEGGLPALELKTPKGRSVRLVGYIDRVDLAELADETLGVVIDYKRTRDKRLDLTEVYHGLSLQLLGYLLVLAERGESLAGRPVQPVGAFYVSLSDQYQSVVHPEAAPTVEETALQAFGPRGVFDADRYDVLDDEYEGTGAAHFYKLFRKHDGALGHVDSTDAADAASFNALLEHTRKKLGELADLVIDGDVDVTPYRLRRLLPCKWCEYAAVCRYEFGPARPRQLESYRRSAVLRLVARSS
jgi:ATP-dependent helicase/nuclease subunit B